MSSGSGVARLSSYGQQVMKNPPPLKRSISDGDLSSSKKKAKHLVYQSVGILFGYESAPVTPPPITCSIISRTKTDTKPLDPKLCLDEAWGLLKPAIRSIFLDEQPYTFSCSSIFQTVNKAWWAKSGEALYKLILDECGTYISKDLESIAGHCNDNDPSLFVSLLVKSKLDFDKNMRFLCTLAGRYRRNLEQLGLELFPTHLFWAPQVRDKVLSIILDGIRDQRLGKSVDTSQLNNLMCMCDGKCFRKSSLLKKPFLDSAAAFYAAEAMQVLEQSDVSQYLKFVERRLGEEKSKGRDLDFFAIFKHDLIETVTRELLGVHACAILEKGFEKFMDDYERHWEDLLRMYKLFSEADLVHHINDALSSYILKNGEKISSEGSSLEEFMARLDEIFISYFSEDPMLEETLEKYFEGFGCLGRIETPCTTEN